MLPTPTPPTTLISLEQVHRARAVVSACPYVVRTPMLANAESRCPYLRGDQSQADLGALPPAAFFAGMSLFLKLENTQVTGSFKIRGVANYLQALSNGDGPKPPLVTMSAGNFGRSFAFAARQAGFSDVTVCMPTTAPIDRVHTIESYGARVERMPSSSLKLRVDELVATTGAVFAHPFDDLDLICGHATLGLEIMSDVPEPDIVVCTCGGGGYLAGVAAVIKQTRPGCRVVGVEPEGAAKMYQSMREGRPVTLDHVNTIAAGLAPPFAGRHTFAHAAAFVDEIVLVSDAQIVAAMRMLFGSGLVVEPSGAAAVAAVMAGKVPNVSGKRVICVVSGGNVTAQDAAALLSRKD